MSIATEQEKPIALIVEDRQADLDIRRRLFNSNGFQSIGAKTPTDALREFRSTPAIDLVVLDINLIADDTNDKSGVDLARKIRKRRPNIPLMGVSGQFGTLDESERKVFDDYLLKGTLDTTSLRDRLVKWRGLALERRRTRAEAAKGRLERIRQDRSFPEPDVEVLRDFLPGAHAKEEPDDHDFLTPDEILRREGWRLRLVDAGFQVADVDEEAARTAMPILLWLRQEAGVVVAVLHEHSCIYHDAPTEHEATQGALELMLDYHRQLSHESEDSLSGELQLLRTYLLKVFGELGHADENT